MFDPLTGTDKTFQPQYNQGYQGYARNISLIFALKKRRRRRRRKTRTRTPTPCRVLLSSTSSREVLFWQLLNPLLTSITTKVFSTIMTSRTRAFVNVSASKFIIHSALPFSPTFARMELCRLHRCTVGFNVAPQLSHRPRPFHAPRDLSGCPESGLFAWSHCHHRLLRCRWMDS